MRRRDLLKLGGLALGGAALAPHLAPRAARAQQPRRGGTVTIRAWDPPHFDPHLTVAYKTIVPNSFALSRLVRHKAGPAIAPGTFAIEGDLAESWSQPNDTTYVFKLRRGARWHPKPPVNGREVTAEDVLYSVERFRTVKGNPNAYMLDAVDKVDAPDRWTVRFTLKQPFAWFLDMLAFPVYVPIIARECVEKFGDLKKPEAVVGTGPWMLDAYRPNVGMTFVRNPHYFLPGLPYLDRIELVVDEDNASRVSSFLAGKYDLGWETPGIINRTDWLQLQDALKQRRPNLKTLEFTSSIMTHVAMRSDSKPFGDARVRQAIALAVDRQGLIDGVLEGAGVVNGPLRAFLKDWALPVDKLGEGAKFYKHDPAEAKRLLAAAGYPNGFAASVCFTNYGSSLLVDVMQLVLKYLKDVGINAKLDQKEYGAYIASCVIGQFDSMLLGPYTTFFEPHNELYAKYYPNQGKNQGHVNDPIVTVLVDRQSRTLDVTKRRELIHELQRHLARQQYYVELPSDKTIGVWDAALKNYAPNYGNDYGGRLMAAWVER
jgi:peptide/nickel transport system substrate-binding protein